MVRALSRNELHRGIDRHFPIERYQYPCNFAKSNERCDITIAVTHQPNSGFLSEGVYHLDLVPCTCPRPKILRRIQSLFRKKTREQQAKSKELRAYCRFHNNNFDVLVKSNQDIYSFLA